MATKPQKNFRLSDSAIDLLEKAVGDGSTSEYLEKVIAQRWEQWTCALRDLRDLGWQPAELLAACNALNGTGLIGPSRSAKAVAHELDNGSSGAAANIPARTWNARVKQIASHELAAHALVTLVSEFWAGNQACARAVGAR